MAAEFPRARRRSLGPRSERRTISENLLWAKAKEKKHAGIYNIATGCGKSDKEGHESTHLFLRVDADTILEFHDDDVSDGHLSPNELTEKRVKKDWAILQVRASESGVTTVCRREGL
jgi:hypothetical protein